MTRATYYLLLLFYLITTTRQIVTKLNGTKIEIRWRTDWKSETVYYSVRLGGQSIKWLLIGQSDHGKYEGSDYCKLSATGIQDGYIDENLIMRADRQQDCRIRGRSRDGSLKFSKKFFTCDTRDYAVEGGTTQFVVATGHGDELTLNEKTVSKIIIYGQLMNKQANYAVSNEEVHQQLQMTAANALIPSEVTTYWCRVIRLSGKMLRHKHHIVKMDAVITPGNEHLVHHMELFHCTDPGYDIDMHYSGYCNDPSKPQETHGCSKVIAAWAFGAQPIIYPKNAGMPIGGPDYYPYLMLEVHYNNVAQVGGVIDNSGIEITVTDQLRPYDAGVMELGLIYSDANSIPPGQNAFTMTGYCTADCTQKFPKDGIKVFASQLHTHLTGRKLWTSHYRNGIKIGEVNRDNHFSPFWQRIQNLPNIVTILPGDVLATTCVFDTTARKVFTWGGYGIEDEMCVNYIHYYPASDVEVCKSAIDNATLRDFFDEMLAKFGSYGYIKLRIQLQ